ncbi:MAG: hypothetical protein ABR584_03535 [Candidatus Baltobacteraceae bacterium]
MPNQANVSQTPGWMVLTRKAAEVAGLAIISRLLEERTPARRSDNPPAPIPFEAPPTPGFITEIVDAQAHVHRAQLPEGKYLFAGFYSDGRVRLATEGRRFSGVMMEQRAVIADLREDVSFEMGVAVHAHAGDLLMLEMDGGPWDGQTLQCETV